jgi:HPt (histidine-containing phosphotransfer) domain-containing protein
MDSAVPPPSAPGPAPSFQERYAALARDWRNQLPARLEELQARTAACRRAPGESQSLDELYRQVHTLAGSAGTFGLAAVGDRAREMEHEVLRVMALAPRTPADFDGVQRELDALRAAAPQEGTP